MASSAPLFLAALAFAAVAAGQDLPIPATKVNSSSCDQSFRHLIVDTCGDIQPFLQKVTQACCVAQTKDDGKCVCPAIVQASRRLGVDKLTGVCVGHATCAKDDCSNPGLSAVGTCARALENLKEKQSTCLCKLDEIIEGRSSHVCLVQILNDVGIKYVELIHALCKATFH